MMEWSTDTKNGYDDLQVYMEYGYVFVSSVGGNTFAVKQGGCFLKWRTWLSNVWRISLVVILLWEY